MSAGEPFNVRTARCPGCGAPIGFKVGSSRVVVCEYCGFAVARTDGGLEELGRVADVVPTGARLAIGVRGRLEGVGFQLVGRLQLRWEQGAWDEWYAAFDDDRWGWIAEAGGRYFVTFPTDRRPAPTFSALQPGVTVVLGGLGRYVVSDVRSATLSGARGELPDPAPLDGRPVHLVDVSGRDGAFATLDYGHDTHAPQIYAGREVPFDALHLDTSGAEVPPPLPTPSVQAEALRCPHCQAPVELRAPDQSMRVTCAHCDSLLDVSHGSLRWLTVLKKVRIRYPTGSRATFFGVEYVVAGWLERAIRSSGETFTWEEFLLYDERSGAFRYLVCSAGHWSFVTPIAPGDVERGSDFAIYEARVFRRFDAGQASVLRVWGEFPWAVQVGERVNVADFVSPPDGLSEERTRDEVTWSHAVYVSPDAVRRAFRDARSIPPPQGVGMLQPNPHDKGIGPVLRWATGGTIAAIVLFVLFLASADNRVLLEQPFQLVAGEGIEQGPAPTDPRGQPLDAAILFSEPFELDLPHRNLQVHMDSDVSNGWVAVNGMLINETSDRFVQFDLESSYYAGQDVDGRWVEDKRDADAFLSDMPTGRYVLRLEAVWERGKPPPVVWIRLTSGVARWTHLFLVLAALWVWPVVQLVMRTTFEGRRWGES